MKTKLNLLAFLLPLCEIEMNSEGAGASSPAPAVIAAADSPSALAETSTEQSTAGDENAVEGTKAPEQSADPLEGLPSLEELEQQAANNVPYAKGLHSVRGAYEALKAETGPVIEQFTPWKDAIEKIGDPTQAQTAYELTRLLHSPVIENGVAKPDSFTTRPFLERLETESPGAVDQIFADLLVFPVPDENGKEDTLVRHLYRSHGLDPDRLEDYRNIDTLRGASGIVTAEQLQGIDPKFHGAFKALSQAQRDDILAQKGTDEKGNTVYPPAAQDYLQDKMEALEARQFREQFQNDQKAQGQAKQAQLEQEIQTESDSAISTARKEIYNSIYQTLASVNVSSDELENEFHRSGIMSNLYTLLDPVGRELILEPLLKKAGISLDSQIAGVQVPFDDTLNSFEQSTRAAKRFEKQGRNWDASEARKDATKARQLLTAKLSQIARKFAQPALNGAANGKIAGNGDLGATARTVPSGNAVQQQVSENPYDANPHPFGTQEYIAYNRRIDKQLGVGNAAVFSN